MKSNNNSNKKASKKALIMSLTAALAIGAPINVINAQANPIAISAPIAISDVVSTPGADVYQQEQLWHIYETKAEILEINKDSTNTENIISILAQSSDELHDQIQFNISEQTVFVDNENGIAADPRTLKAGDTIYVYSSMAMTMSIPPQSSAYVILTNLDKKSPARYIEVERNDVDEHGNAYIIDADGNYNVNIESDTPTIPYLTRQMVYPSHLEAGDRILVWSEIMALSHPAMVAATKVMLLPKPVSQNDDTPTTLPANSDSDSIIISTMAGVFSINGQEVHPLDGETLYKKQNGILMVPIRSISESFGFQIEWQADTKTVTLQRGPLSATATIGSKIYGKYKMLVQLETAAEIINGRTHVPVDFISEVLGADVEVNDSHV